MYKLLIVDDEYWVRKRLISTIDWSSLGISEIYEAEDGKQALSLSIAHEPDIIVTDINMPELSGIELMRALNESALYPRIILISGYNEFEYARSAIKLGAVDYLLKPVDENELLTIIKGCIEDFEKKQKEMEMLNALVGSTAEIRKRVIKDLITGKFDNSDNSLLRLKHIGMNFSFSSAICVTARSRTLTKTDNNDYVEETLVNFSILNVMEDIFPQFFQHFFTLPMDDMSTAVIFSDKAGEDLQADIKAVIDNIGNVLEKVFNTNIAFGIGIEVSNIFNLNESFKTAFYSMNYNDYKDWSQILNYGETDKTEHMKLQNIYQDYNLNAISNDIKNGDSSSAFSNLELLTDEFFTGNNKSPNPIQAKLFYIHVMNTLFKNCLVSCPITEEFLKICIDSLNETEAFFTAEKLMANLKRIVNFLVSQYNTYLGNKRHWLIDKIIEYINDNYAAPITMNEVASNFFLNPSYFSKLFHEETGLTFTHYLMKLRVEKAKELMCKSNKKFYDIAAEVGYSNVQYFSTIFKEIEGITPSQYRSSL